MAPTSSNFLRPNRSMTASATTVASRLAAAMMTGGHELAIPRKPAAAKMSLR